MECGGQPPPWSTERPRRGKTAHQSKHHRPPPLPPQAALEVCTPARLGSTKPSQRVSLFEQLGPLPPSRRPPPPPPSSTRPSQPSRCPCGGPTRCSHAALQARCAAEYRSKHGEGLAQNGALPQRFSLNARPLVENLCANRPLRRRFSFFNGCAPYRWKISCPNRPLRQAFSCPAESLVAAPKNGPFRTRGKRRDAMARWTVTLKLAGLCPRFIMLV